MATPLLCLPMALCLQCLSLRSRTPNGLGITLLITFEPDHFIKDKIQSQNNYILRCLGLGLQNINFHQAHPFNPSSREAEAEAGRSLCGSLRPAWFMRPVPDKPRLLSKTFSQKTRINKNNTDKKPLKGERVYLAYSSRSSWECKAAGT